MEAKNFNPVPPSESTKPANTPKRPHSKAGKLKTEINSFKECISAFSKNLELKSSTCEELQELFFKLANANKSLPENADQETVQSFIAILVTVISVNYGYPIALQGISVLFTYLKGDDRVFNQFRPNKDIMTQLNIDKYLSTEGEEGKDLVLDFVCFLLRYYKDIEHTDLSSDAKVLARIRKAEFERTWADIENLAVNQENILKANEQNQQITSNAFAELFAHIEEIKKNYETSIGDLKKEITELKNSQNPKSKYYAPQKGIGSDENIDPSMMKKIENTMNDKVSELRKILDTLMAETSNLESKHDETAKKLEETSAIVDETSKAMQDITNMINFENQLIKDSRSVLLTRLSKTENDIIAISSKLLVQGGGKIDSPGKAEPKEMANLRIDSIRNQIDTELLPKVNEMMVKIGSLDVSMQMIKAQQAKGGDSSISNTQSLLAKIDERGMNFISSIIKGAIDTISVESKGNKKLVDTIKDQVAKIQQGYDNIKEEIKTEIEQKIKHIENSTSSQVEGNTEQFKLFSDRLKSLGSDSENIKKQISEIITQVKSFSDYSKYDQKYSQVDDLTKKHELKLSAIEEKVMPIEGKLHVVDDIVKSLEEHNRALIERITILESKGNQGIMGSELNSSSREELSKRIDQLKLQMQGYFDSSWTYIQQFADLHAIDKMKEIQAQDGNYTSKLNCLEWLIRYHEFLSGKSTLQVIEAFKELIHPTRVHERAAYASTKHNSDIINQLVVAMRNIKKGTTAEEMKNALSDAGTNMAVLELALINDQNVESAIALGVIKDIITYLIFFRTNYDPKLCTGEIKLAVRCMTYCFRNIKAVDALIDVTNGLTTVTSLIQSSKDEEIMANSIKIIRVCLRSDKQYDKIIQKIPTLFQILMQILSSPGCSTILLEESTAALRNYTRKIYVLDFIDDPTNLAPICKFAADKVVSKYREYSVGILRNCCKNQKLLNYIKQTAAYENVVKSSNDDASIGQLASGSESRYYS